MTRTRQDLQMLQALPLDLKIPMTKARIRQWVNEFGEEGVYVSFSGGKDSTVLLHLVREMYPRVPAVFVDTGLEYPEIRDFVKTFDNVTWLRPKMNFRQVIEKYGYPFASKEVSKSVHEARRGKPDAKVREKFDDNSEKNKKYTGYSLSRWAFLLDEDAPRVSHMCCNIMKKNVSHNYEKKTGRKKMTGMMAEESRLRAEEWIRRGCNAFDGKTQVSNPMSFWREQDVLLYIYLNHIEIAPVYGDVVKDTEVEGQMDFADMGLFDQEMATFKTTGAKRTGCMFCGFGCHLDECPSRFERMKETHPKQYNYIMKPWEEGGLGYKEVIDWINEHGNLNIRY